MTSRLAYKTYKSALEQACLLAHQAAESQGRCVLLVSSYSAAVRVKKFLARKGWGFGVDVETPSTWIVDLWEMLGDGRQLVCPVDRLLFCLRAMKRQGDMLQTSGMMQTLSNVARRALPFAVAQDAAIEDSARTFCECLRDYDDMLMHVGLVEESQAAKILSGKGAVNGLSVVVLDCATSASQDLLLQGEGVTWVEVDVGCDCEGLVEGGSELDHLRAALFHPDFDNPIQATGQVEFSLPAGSYASSALLISQLEGALKRVGGDGDVCVAVAAKRPLEMFDKIAPSLVKRGMDVRVRALQRYEQTAFGRAWMSLMGFVSDQDWTEQGSGYSASGYATDFDMSLFAFMGLGQAQSLDKRMRGWRGQTIDEALTDMAAYARDDQRDFMAAIIQKDYVKALEIQRDWVETCRSWPEAYRVEQLSAIDATLGVFARAQDLNMEAENALFVLPQVLVPVTAQLRDDEVAIAGVVDIMALRDAAALEPESVHIVALCDLSASDYPLKNELRAADLLMEQLGAAKHVDRIGLSRRWFAAALQAASDQVILQRCLHDEKAEESRPAALLEELIDCYRRDPQNVNEIDKYFGLPACLMPFAFTRGEEGIAENVSAEQGSVPLEMTLERFSTGHVNLADCQNLAPTVQDPSTGETFMRLSPSAIESYLECPHLWFVQRRLRTSQIDADFGPRAFGTFSHTVLERFHKGLAAQGMSRVTPACLDEALGLLDRVFDQQVKDEQGRISDDAVIALNQIERAKIERTRKNLRKFVCWESELLPDYVPYQAEMKFGHDNPFDYAGVKLVGSIDRIDVGAFNQAAVIDYKGSVGPAYNFRAKDSVDWELPRKVQTAIYAQAVRRRLGMVPVAALYVSYSKPGLISGVFDELALDAKRDLPGIKRELCGSASFLDDLDRCEEAIALKLDRLRRGLIEPAPLDADACKYCPVALCERRLG